MSQPVRVLVPAACVALLGIVLPAAAAAANRVTHVRVNALENPVGIDTPAPQFSWVLESSRRGARQVAYRVRVANTPAELRKGGADVWDSGRQESPSHAHVVYAGPTLAAGRTYHVEITAWDDAGAGATAPASFEMGQLDPAAWKARWIGLTAKSDDERLPFVGARWIWLAPGKDANGKRVVLRKHFTVAADERVRHAELALVVPSIGHQWEPHMQKHVFINDVPMREFAGGLGDPRRIVITAGIKPGDNELFMDSPMTMQGAMVAAILLDLEDGRRKVIPSDDTWVARTYSTEKLPEGWRAEAANKAPWAKVKDLGAFGEVVDAKDPTYKAVDRIVPPIVLRKRFRLDKPIARARLYATAAGVYEAHLNGRKVGDHVLAPGWTDYHKRIRYQTFDVTKDVRKGDNVLGGVVASGWYSGRTGMGQSLWGFDKALFAELHVQYADGSTDVVATDESWEGTTGPWRAADLLDGEHYDARRELVGWSSPSGKMPGDSFRPVIVLNPKVGKLEAQVEPPVRQIQTLAARAVTSPAPGVQIFDLGQNMVGSVRLKVQAPAGTPIRLRFVEMLNKDGTAFTDALRTALATDVYITNGKGVEVYEPRFTFHGFRYVEVSGHPRKLPASAVTGLVQHSALPQTGAFETSNAQLNKLQSNILWGQKGNFFSVPTDCPQRDERLGWTGDINMFARTAMFNMDSHAFLGKYLVDVSDGQRADGAVADVAPTTPALGAGSFGWGDVAVFLPWLMYEVYGDPGVLSRHYDMMKRWVDFRTTGAKNDLNTKWSFGDWVSPPPQTPNDVLGPMYHAHAARLLARSARVLGRNEEAKKYEDLVERIRRAFAAAYVSADGKIKSDTQTAYIVALRYDMLPEALRPAAARHLTAAIERANRHLNTGFLGTGNLLPALSQVGQNELAYELLLKDTMPSWLFTVKNGATTMWERWDGYSPETGPNNKGDMNSYNHYAFGAVGEWMYAHVAGLDYDPAVPGFGRVIVRPIIGGGLTSARARYDSIAGRVSSGWKLTGNSLSLDVQVPVHATARVYVPAAAAEAVKEGGKSAQTATGVKFVAFEQGHAVFDVGSGTYRFTAPAR